MKTQPLLLYTDAFKVSAKTLTRLRKAGYIPVKVDNFDCVKIVDPLPLGQTDAIARAAFDAVASCSYIASGIPENFGRAVAKALGTQPKKV